MIPTERVNPSSGSAYRIEIGIAIGIGTTCRSDTEKMETETVTNVATASFSHMCVEISSPLLVWGATVLWCVIVGIVVFTLARRVADAAINVHRIGGIVALILCGFVLVMVSAEAEREIATWFFIATNPRVASVGIWNNFPRWPSMAVTGVTVLLTAYKKMKRQVARTNG